MKAYGVLEVNIHASLTWALYGGVSLALRFTPWKRTPVHTGQKKAWSRPGFCTRKANICSCRESNTDCPVTMLTQLINVDTKLKCLNAGSEYSLQWRKPQKKISWKSNWQKKQAASQTVHTRASMHARKNERTGTKTCFPLQNKNHSRF
jgi:hypothetical protein